MMELKELFAQKGELVTQIEILQSRLTFINKQIIEIANNQKKEKDNEPEI